MKNTKRFLAALLVFVMLFVFSVYSYGIDFDAEELYNSVFVIYSDYVVGSGFSIAENCIITNAHVVDDPTDVTIEGYTGDTHRAEVIGIDYDLDIAVLLVRDASFPALTLRDESSCEIGDDIYAVGAPMSMSYTLTKGIISALERNVSGYEYIQIDAPINHGNSGGPLLNKDGEVIGVNTFKMTDSEGIGLSVPTSSVVNFLDEIGISIVGNRVNEDDYEPEVAPIEPSESKTEEEYPKNHSPLSDKTVTAIAFIVATVSVCLNIILIVCLIVQKKRKPNPVIDKRERTDFDIEILG